MESFRGSPYPLGATLFPNGFNFALATFHATTVSLCLIRQGETVPFAEFPLDPHLNCTGDVWHILVAEIPESTGYAYRIDGNDTLTLDPYAKGVCSTNIWRSPPLPPPDTTHVPDYHPIGWIPQTISFDWQGDKHPNIPLDKLVIYEMHVRGFTNHPSSKVEHPGTFLGLIEKIPHLIELGINAVEFLPLFEFNEFEYLKANPLTGVRLHNYWGYSTVNFFSPMLRYSTSPDPGVAIQEFKLMVRELHRHGIEVILDVVYNHTSEGDERGPSYCYKNLDNNSYYMLDSEGNYLNYTGCGNTFNCNHPLVRNLIIKSLRYWLIEMHVDGFRFDLASVLMRGRNGEPLENPPLIESISEDPFLKSCKLIAEPWDATGFYQVGDFYLECPRWCEWNGQYRDTVRRFIRGDNGMIGTFATRLAGSQDLYSTRTPLNSINFVTSHDGFTLHDLVSYNIKHNIENAENNRDGSDHNDSWNCGVEGQTEDKELLALRQRQMRNLHLALMVSQGIPMISMGDEYAHTKLGNNNTWCQDNDLNWFLWDQLEENRYFFRFFSKLIEFRQSHRLLHLGRFLTNQDITWHGLKPESPKWSAGNHFLAFTLIDLENHQDLYIAFNASNQTQRATLPSPPEHKRWTLVVNTANLPPDDFYEAGRAPYIEETELTFIPFSAVMLVAK